MVDKESTSVMHSRKAYIIAGLFTVIPLLITWWVVKFILQLLREFGSPAVAWLALAVRSFSPYAADLVLHPFFDSVLAVVLALLGLYLLGWAATRVIGRRLLAAFDAMVQRIPLVNTVYSAVQKFLAVLQTKPDGVQRVVLIDFSLAGDEGRGFCDPHPPGRRYRPDLGRGVRAHHPQSHFRLSGNRAPGEGGVHHLDHG
jgi:uncharacterized membrane protein